MMEITDVFEFHYNESHDVNEAEQSFREAMKNDSNLKDLYRNWCDEMGYTERKGFKSYFINKAEGDNIWDSIFPNKEELDEYDFDSK
ncbi:MAG: hypothetical protein Q4F97_02755 [Bacteroidales bacterium]|nr:hypothetical protein [Bacteroidales bacterium]